MTLPFIHLFGLTRRRMSRRTLSACAQKGRSRFDPLIGRQGRPGGGLKNRRLDRADRLGRSYRFAHNARRDPPSTWPMARH